MKHFSDIIGYVFFRLIVLLVKWTPICFLYAMSSLLARLFAHMDCVFTTRTAKRNLERAFYGIKPREVNVLCRKYYECIIDYFIEFVKRDKWSEEHIKCRCVFHNVELLLQKFEKHHFVICYSGHLLNFELTVSLPLHIPGYGMCHLYLSGEHNKAMDWVLKSRSRFGAINIPTSSPLKILLQLNESLISGTSEKKGYVFGTLAEQDTREKNPHKSSFFDYELEVLTGSERIGRKLDMAFVYAHITRPKRGYYEVEFKEMAPADIDINPYAYTDEFVRMLEQNIKEQPELWMQWGECRF